MRRVLVAVVLAVGLVAAGPTAAPAGAEETWLFDDGEPCTAVPNSLPGLFDFTQACAAHDACYDAGVDRLACDLAFRTDMIELCQVQHPEALSPGRLICQTFAELYFLGVRILGGFAFA